MSCLVCHRDVLPPRANRRARVTTTARNGQHIAVEADHAHRGLLERRPYLTLTSEIRGDVAIANLNERPLREMRARVCDLGGRCNVQGTTVVPWEDRIPGRP
jgi:hypothetical protein